MVITRPCDDNRLQYHPHIYHNFHFHGYRYRHFIAAMLPWRRRRWLWCMGMTKRKSIRCCDVRVSRADCWNSESSWPTQRIPTQLPTTFFWLFLLFFLYFSCIFLKFFLLFRKQLRHSVHYVSGHWIKELKSFERYMHILGSILIQIWKLQF